METGFARVDKEFAQVRGEMDAGFAQMRSEMDAGFARVDKELAQVRGEMDAGFAQMRSEMEKSIKTLLYAILSTGGVLVIGMITALIKFWFTTP